MNKKSILLSGTVLAGLAVALGAIGSHALKELLTQAGRMETFETAVRYQLYHGLALLITGLLSDQRNNSLKWVGLMFFWGTVLFSGSLYALSLTSIHWVVYVTPMGGALMLGGWALLLYRLVKMKQ